MIVGTERCHMVDTPEEKIVYLSLCAFEVMCKRYCEMTRSDRMKGRLIVYTEIGQVFVLDNYMWDGFSAGGLGVRSVTGRQVPKFKRDDDDIRYGGDGNGEFANPRPSFDGTEIWVLHEVRVVDQPSWELGVVT